jgi:hypothetical protein
MSEKRIVRRVREKGANAGLWMIVSPWALAYQAEARPMWMPSSWAP